tara:strand:- start:91 stop:282 length:192 start_codon:yes stop_codon:yes gene_type:complete
MKQDFSKNKEEDIDWNTLDPAQFSTKMSEQFGDQLFNEAFDIVKKNGADGEIFNDDFESKCIS